MLFEHLRPIVPLSRTPVWEYRCKGGETFSKHITFLLNVNLRLKSFLMLRSDYVANCLLKLLSPFIVGERRALGVIL